MLAGRTRRPGVAIAEGSGSSERRRRRVVAAVAAPSAIHQYILSSAGICGGWVEADRSPRPRVDVRENLTMFRFRGFFFLLFQVSSS